MAKKEKKEITISEKKETVKKYGNIELPINEADNAHIPTNAKRFIDHQDILKTIALGIKHNKNTLIIGESGLGKTSAIRYMAQETNTPLRRINLSGGTTADELVGRNGINLAGTYWIDGVLTECMRNGYWLILDEINAASAEVTFVLHSLLDDDGYIVLTEKPDKEIVKKHPNFRFFATCNPPEYAGTKEMNTALLSRFHICIYAQFPKIETEKEIIKEHLGEMMAGNLTTEKLLKLAEDSRINKSEEKTDYCINTRDVINTLSLCEEYTPIEALKYAFINKLNKEDRKSFEMIAALQLPQRKINPNEKGIKDIKNLILETEYTTTKEIENYTVEVTDTTETLGAIMLNNPKISIQKDESFIVKGYFTENATEETTKIEESDDIVAIKIEITKGKNKGKNAIILLVHNKESFTEKLVYINNT